MELACLSFSSLDHGLNISLNSYMICNGISIDQASFLYFVQAKFTCL